MKFKYSFEWTNWTLGVWWSTQIGAWGIDLGPLEMIWHRKKKGRRS